MAGAFGAITAGTRGLRTSFGLVGKGAAFAAGAAGLGGLIAGIKGVYEEGREAQKVGAQTAAVIRSTGGAAKVSAAQVGALATAISNQVGVDDELIQSGENLLLTFTGIGRQVFPQASRAIVDMTAAMNGGVVTQQGLKASALQVGKALQDPIKGTTALRKVGVALSEAQVKQIKTLTEHGHALDAQKIILGELNKEFGGSAAAGTNAMQKLGVVFGNIKEQVGTALLPVIDKLATWLAQRLPGALAVATRWFGNIETGVKGLFDLLAHGDFTGNFAKAFHVSEDSPVVGVLLKIRAGILDTATWVRTTGAPAVGRAFGAIETYVTTTVLPGITTAFGKIDLSGIAKSFTAQATTWGSALIDGVRTGLDTGDWSALGQTVGKGIAAAIEGAGQFAKTIAGKIGDLLGKVDWVGIGISVGKQVPSLLIGLAAGLLNFDLMGLLKGLWQHWQEVLLAIIALAFTPARIIGKVAEVLARIPLVGKLLAWALEHLAGFSKGLVRMVGDALGFMGRAFLDGFRSVFPKVGAALAGWLRLLPTRIGVAALDVAAAARRMIRGLGDAITSMVGWVVRNIGQLIAQMLRPWVNAARWLIGRGREIITGLWGGISSRWADVVGWFSGIGRRVVGWFAGAGRWLVTAGYNIIGGLWGGFKSAMGGVGRILGQVKDAIIGGLKRLFGIHSPSTVMAGLGVHIITGLIKGMLTQSGALARTVRDIGGNVSNIFGATLGNVGGGLVPDTRAGSVQAMVKGYAQMMFGWSGAQWDALYKLIMRESGFNPNAQNPTSTAYGIFQFLDSTWAAFGVAKSSNPNVQTLAGLQYIKQRYGDPRGAWNHELMAGWYGAGMPPTVFSRPTLIGVGERGPETVSVTPHSNSTQRLHPADIRALGEVIGRTVLDGIRANNVAVSRTADLYLRGG